MTTHNQLVRQQMSQTQNRLREIAKDLKRTANPFEVMMLEDSQIESNYRQRGRNTQLLYELKTILSAQLKGWLTAQENMEKKLNSTKEKLNSTEEMLNSTEEMLNSTKEKLSSTKETLKKYETSVLNSYKRCLRLVDQVESLTKIKFANNFTHKQLILQTLSSIWIELQDEVLEIDQLVESTTT